MSSSSMAAEVKSRHVSVCAEVTENLLVNTSSNIQKRNYVLNDVNALKKKVKHESRTEPFTSGNDARDGSNVVIAMKTSFFEYTKSKFLNDLLENPGIVKVDNALGSKVASSNSKEAFVEYSVDITFSYQNDQFVVKLTAYTTSCQVMVQPVGERVKLGSRTIPRYFVDTFILPWCETAYANKPYNENEIIDALHEEIKRLDLIKLSTKKHGGTRTRLPSVSTSESRCVAKGCKYSGINSNNKSAVGVCSKCGCFEHYECSKTRQEDREEIAKGNMKYFCSSCFRKNPSMVAFEIPSRAYSLSLNKEDVPVVEFPCNECQIVFSSESSLKEQ